jgi:hypothetical protein
MTTQARARAAAASATTAPGACAIYESDNITLTESHSLIRKYGAYASERAQRLS